MWRMNIPDFEMGGFLKVGTWNSDCENKYAFLDKSLDEVLNAYKDRKSELNIRTSQK